MNWKKAMEPFKERSEEGEGEGQVFQSWECNYL